MEQSRKRVLMFCVRFFGYEKRIADGLRAEGYEVDLYDERPSENFVGKACVRYNVGLYRPVIQRHVRRIIQENQEKHYDYVLVVKGEAIDENAVALLREAWPNAKFVLYLWDSVRNIPDCEKRMQCYDRVLSFDAQDAETYGAIFLPIPYDEAALEYSDSQKYCYDIAFIGTAHSIRPRIVRQLEEECAAQNRRMYHYFYSPHILVFLLNKLTNPEYRGFSIKDVHFKPLASEQVYEIYSQSRCILDVEHPKQSGTTTRPVEMLPMKKKIITTNQHVKNFLFFNENNFFIIDRDHPKVDPTFWDTPYVSIEEDVIEKYSPKHFVCTLLGDTKKSDLL